MSLSATVADAVAEGGRHPVPHNRPDWLMCLEDFKKKALFFGSVIFTLFCVKILLGQFLWQMHAVCKIVFPCIHTDFFHYLILFIN